MGLIRRAYKREYGVELVDDLLQRCGEAGSLLAQVAAKGATSHTTASKLAPAVRTRDTHTRRQVSPVNHVVVHFWQSYCCCCADYNFLLCSVNVTSPANNEFCLVVVATHNFDYFMIFVRNGCFR